VSELYHLDLDLSEHDASVVTDRLVAYNQTHGPATLVSPERASPLRIAVRSADGELVGGLIGRTHAIPFWLEISVLWVDEAARRHGLGRRLMERAEREARLRGCCFVRLATSDYQAPDFYKKQGYIQYGLLEDCPPGETAYYLRKTL